MIAPDLKALRVMARASIEQARERNVCVPFQVAVCAQDLIVLLDRLEAAAAVPLASEHKSMRVDYCGMLGEARRLVRLGIASETQDFMLGELADHLTELGQRFYAGDLTVVDEFLQLYCIGREQRAAVVAKQGAAG